MPMLVGDKGRQTLGERVWLGWDPAHPALEQQEALPSSITVPSAPALGPLPAVGWRCSAADAAEALGAGAQLLFADGDAGAETAVAEALDTLDGDAAAAVRIVTSLEEAACQSPEDAQAACDAATSRLGGRPIDVLLLPPSAWGVAAGLLEAGAARSVGLIIGSAALAVPALQEVLLAGGAQPAMLCLPLHPLVPLVQRMLLGLCRRKGVRVVALEPLGGDMAEGVQAAAAAATAAAADALQMRAEAPAVDDAEPEGGAEGGAAGGGREPPPQEWQSEATSVLLGWCVARDVIALPGSVDARPPAELLPLSRALPPMPLALRRALDELAPPNGTEVGFGPGKWVPPDHLKDRYEVFKGDSNWNRTEQ